MGSSGWSTDKLERADDVAADVGEAQPGSRLSPDCGLLHFNLDWGGGLFLIPGFSLNLSNLG